MNNKITMTHIMSLSLLLLLPGCTLFVDKEDKTEREPVERKELEKAAVEVLTDGISVIDKDELTGEVFITLNGKPVVTSDNVARDRETLLEANPQVKQILPFLPPEQLKQIDRSIAEGLKNQAIMDQYISDHGIDKTAAYQKEMRQGIRGIERMVNIKFFSKNLEVNVTDAEIRKFYDDNKDLMPELMVSRGGTKAMGIPFDSQEAARTFAEQISAENDLQKAAQAQNISDRVRDFGVVNQQSMIPEAAVKNAILGVNRFPSTQVVPVNDKNVWVITASEKENVSYQPFEEVKTGLKSYLEKVAFDKKFAEEMERLGTLYNVEIKADFLKASPEEEMTGMEEEMQVDADFDDAIDTVAFYEQLQSTI